MRTRSILLLLVLALVLPTTAAGAATAEIDETITLNRGESGSYTSDPAPGGINPTYFEAGQSCTKSVETYCEHVLLELVNPVADDGDPTTTATARRTLNVDLSTVAADYDLFIYSSDAEGTIGGELGSSTSYPAGDTSESVSTSITTTETVDTKYVLVRVVFFAPVTPMTLDARF